MGKSFVIDCDALPAQSDDGAFEVNVVPKGDGSDNQVETTRPVALVLEAAVTQVTLPLKKTAQARAFLASALLSPTWTRLR